MGPIWFLSAPDGPHVGPINLAIRKYCVLWYKTGQQQALATLLKSWMPTSVFDLQLKSTFWGHILRLAASALFIVGNVICPMLFGKCSHFLYWENIVFYAVCLEKTPHERLGRLAWRSHSDVMLTVGLYLIIHSMCAMTFMIAWPS